MQRCARAPSRRLRADTAHQNACDHLSGFQVGGRYLVVLYHQMNKQTKKLDIAQKREELEKIREKYGISRDDEEPR